MAQQAVVLDGTNQIVLAGKGAVDLNLPTAVTSTFKAKTATTATAAGKSAVAGKGLTTMSVAGVSSKMIATGLAITAVPGATAAIVAATAIGIFSVRKRDTKIFGFRITRD